MPDIAASFSAIDLSRLPVPNVIEQPPYDAIYGANLALARDLIEGWNALVPVSKVDPLGLDARIEGGAGDDCEATITEKKEEAFLPMLPWG